MLLAMITKHPNVSDGAPGIRITYFYGQCKPKVGIRLLATCSQSLRVVTHYLPSTRRPCSIPRSVPVTGNRPEQDIDVAAVEPAVITEKSLDSRLSEKNHTFKGNWKEVQ